MIIKKNRLGLKSIHYIVDEWPKGLNIEELKKKYSQIVFTTYQKQSPGGFKEGTRTTALIKVKNLTLDQVFAKFKYESRHRVRKTYKIKELSFVSDDKDFKANYELYSEFEYKQGRVPNKKELLKNCIFFSAYLNGKIVSQIICQDVDSKILRIRNISSKRLDTGDKKIYRIIAMASRRVMYEAIKHAHANGFEYFDVNGVNLTDPKKKGINEFKMGFGGEMATEYWYVHKSWIYQKLERLVKIKLFILKLFRK